MVSICATAKTPSISATASSAPTTTTSSSRVSRDATRPPTTTALSTTWARRAVRPVERLGPVLWRSGPRPAGLEISGVTFRDCDIIRPNLIAMDIQHSDRALVKDVLFENIRIEIDDRNPQPRMQGNREEQYPANAESRYCPTLLEILRIDLPELAQIDVLGQRLQGVVAFPVAVVLRLAAGLDGHNAHAV